MKKVSIIIPFKDQTEKDLAIVLGSINNQIGIDFSLVDVHLVNDGGSPINLSLFEIFANLELHYHELTENVGPGLARQYGIDHSESEYLMFMDSDDELHFVGALLEFFNVVKDSGDHQLIVGRYIEQFVVENGEFRYLTHPLVDWKAVYAKWFNRAYLKEKGLHFYPSLRIFEDTYFVGLSCQLASDIYYLDSVAYSWLYNSDSLVRKDGKSFEYQTHVWALENRLYLEKIREMQPENLRRDLENYVCDVYMRFTKFPPADIASFWREHTALLEEFKDIWLGYSEELQAKVDAIRDNPDGNWPGISTEGFKAFIENF
ncbi:MAG: glycosyltransferase family 2 protein [Streptococcaceae bacterium]|jgi:glycosyltransferase involved in cell wall biosynthesis|nr:glycosyltransferase family 2 protein [Streptococcaceae bacterium]